MANTQAGLYLRLSREDENENSESNSITNQRMITSDFARQHELEIIDEYVDDGFSGANFERPGWKRLIADCREGRIDCIIVKDYSRMGRNTVECGRYLEQIFPAWGIRFIAIGDMYDSERTNDPTADMTMAFKSLLNDFYCRDMSNKVKVGLKAKMKRGEFIGSFAPYGYKKDPERRGHLLVDEDEAETVRTVFKLKISGMNAKNICGYLDEMGIPSPAARRGIVEGAGWSESAVRGILSNELYLGTMAQGKTRKLSYKSKKKIRVPKDEWIRVEKTHDSIIGWNTFEFVQELLGMDTTTPAGQTRLNLLTGFLRCGDCGQNLNKYSSGANGYYRCSSFVRQDFDCTPHTCSEKKVVGQLLAAVRKRAGLLREVLERMEESGVMPERKKQVAEIDAAISENLHTIADNRSKQALAYRHMTESIMTAEDYVEKERHYQDAIDGAEKDIEKLQERRQKVVDEIAYLIPWLETVKGFGKITELNRTILTTMIHYVEMFEDGSMKVRFRFEDDIAEILSRITIKTQIPRKLIVIQDAFPRVTPETYLKDGSETVPRDDTDVFPNVVPEAFPVERAEVLMEGLA